jgi:hypothetical protein
MRYICNILDMKLLTKKRLLTTWILSPPWGVWGSKAGEQGKALVKKAALLRQPPKSHKT